MTLSVDAALRKAIAHARKDICVKQLSKNPKTSGCSYDRLDGKKTQAVFEQWRKIMKDEHGIDMSTGTVRTSQHSDPSTLKYDTGKGDSEVTYNLVIEDSECHIGGKIKMKIDVNCGCSPFVKVHVDAERIVSKTYTRGQGGKPCGSTSTSDDRRRRRDERRRRRDGRRRRRRL